MSRVGVVVRLTPLAMIAAYGCGAPYPEPRVGAPRELSLATDLAALERDVFTPSCARANCHGTPRRAPFSLEAGAVFGAVVDQPSRQVPALDLVEPGDVEASYLVLKLRGHAGTVGGRDTQMPLNRTPLSEEVVARIETWVAEGAESVPTP